MNEFLKKILSLDRLSQEQRESMIDLLILTMYSDKHLAFDENQLLQNLSQSFDWDSNEPIDYYIRRRFGEFRQILNDSEAIDQTVQLIAENLSNQSEKALNIMEDMIYADNEKVQKENQFYEKVKKALEQN